VTNSGWGFCSCQLDCVALESDMNRNIDIDAEREFENKKVVEGDVRKVQSKFYWSSRPKIDEFNAQVCRELAGKSVVEIGCSDGDAARLYAPHCKKFVGIDLSDEGIKVANARKLPNAEFVAGDAHKLDFAAESFDAVIVNGLLHHMELPKVLPEIFRVLKSKGKLYAREPLGTNPLINLYRSVTPSVRTVDERPFTMADFRLVAQYFYTSQISCFGFASIASAFVPIPALRAVLTKLDEVLALTPLKWLFWQFGGSFEKR
jgi:SAM-dependent methyltransferase